MRWRRINTSLLVDRRQVEDIVAGELSDATVSSLGSRIEAVETLDTRAAVNGRPPLSGSEMARLLGVNKRTVERYRARIRAYSLE